MNHDSETEMRALDHRIAVEVMEMEMPTAFGRPMFSPTTSIADAWLVVGRMVERFGIAYCVELIQYNATEWEASFKADCYGKARTAPLAICLAALEAQKEQKT